MEILTFLSGKYLATYQRQGNDKNGRPLYIINVFERLDNGYYFNINQILKSNNIISKLDKYYNIKVITYDITGLCEKYVNALLQSIE